jgi:serine protease Do
MDLSQSFAELAGALRRSTVQVRGRGPGGGSGVIWRDDGLVITNAHVARGQSATVELWDGRVAEAVVQSRDARRDLAALKFRAAGLQPAVAGNSSRLRPGELVFAMGNPMGFNGALTAGVIHSAGREWIQSDIRLAPGNSGGPLADARGRVVGINTMIASGLGIAVPSRAVERFLRPGQPARLGVTLEPVRLDSAYTGALGLVIVEIERGSPAEHAGLLPGDVIIGVEQDSLDSPADLADRIEDAGAGAPIELQLLRGGQLTRVVAVPAAQPSTARAA